MAKNQPKEKRIKQIIDTAVKEFVEKGYEGTSMNSIAMRAGLSKGGLYHHFHSKDEILIEANNKFMEPIIELMENAKKIKSPTEGLKFYIKEYLKYWSNHARELQFTFLSLYKIMSNKEVWTEMESYLNYITNFYNEMLVFGIAQGELKEHDTYSRAIAIASSLDGITPYLIMSKEFTSNKVADLLIKTYINEIKIK
jgi:AcrR family transcriptional regulator